MTIPNVATFTYVGAMEFHFVHAAAVVSAHRQGGFDRIRLLSTEQPIGTWWEQCRDVVDLEIVTAPDSIFDIPLHHPAHVADVVRMQDMLRHGGTYLDLDVVTVGSFAALRDNDCVFAEQRLGTGVQWGFGCAVMMARPQSPFVQLWYDGYDPGRSAWNGFRSTGKDRYWSEMSTRYPAMLHLWHQGLATVLPHEYFYPFNWEDDDLEGLFGQTRRIPEPCVAIHLWETKAWDYLKETSPRSVSRRSTTFEIACADALEGWPAAGP